MIATYCFNYVFINSNDNANSCPLLVSDCILINALVNSRKFLATLVVRLDLLKRKSLRKEWQCFKLTSLMKEL